MQYVTGVMAVSLLVFPILLGEANPIALIAGAVLAGVTCWMERDS